MNIMFQKTIKLAHFMSQPIIGHALHNSRRSRLIITVGNEVLLVRSSFSKQKWSLPGGGMHKGEDQYHAAARELCEETGVVVDPGDLGLAGELRLPRKKRWPVANVHFYERRLASKPATKINQPLEILEVAWFPLNALPEKRSETVDEGLALLK